MSEFLFLIFLIQALYISIWCFKKYERLLSVLSFFHFAYLGIILVGFIGVVFLNKYPFTEKVISLSLLYAIIIHLAAFLGFNSKKRMLPLFWIKFLFPARRTSKKTSVVIGLVYTVIGFYFFYKYYNLPDELLLAEHSGIVVLYLVFAKILYVGYAILLEVSLRYNIKFLKVVSSIVFVLIFAMLAVRLKRTETLIFLSSTFFMLYHLKGFKLSRTSIMLGGSLFIVLVMYIGEIRNVVNVNFIKGDNISMAMLNEVGEENSLLNKIEKAPELRWAISQMEVSNNQFSFSCGKNHWNRLVNLFVPAQIVGSNVKEFLKFEIPAINVYQYYGMEMFTTGLMNTLLAESFKEFWIFGILFIFILFNLIKTIVNNKPKYQCTYFIVFISLITPYAVTMVGSGSALYLGGSLFYYVYLIPLRIFR